MWTNVAGFLILVGCKIVTVHGWGIILQTTTSRSGTSSIGTRHLSRFLERKVQCPTSSCLHRSSRRSSLIHSMGLYDTPLPPRPNDKNNSRNDDEKQKNPTNFRSDNKNDDSDDDNELESLPIENGMVERLFAFNANGKEVQGWLPPLSRRLVYGVNCYYEPTDRIVQNLIEKTAPIHPEDACWALEACNGDITEAWTRISTARRLKLEQLKQEQQQSTGDDDDDDLWKEFQARKKKLEQQAAQQHQREDWKNSMKPDQPWLPNPNPKPIDDEPWFTG